MTGQGWTSMFTEWFIEISSEHKEFKKHYTLLEDILEKYNRKPNKKREYFFSGEVR